MSDTIDDFRAMKEHLKERKQRLGIDCPGCRKVQPKRTPTRLMPGQRCKVCGYIDMRKDTMQP